MTYWTAGQRITGARLENFVQRGEELVSFSGLQSFTQPVTFPVPFAAPPIVLAGIASGSGSTSRWHIRAISITATGFELFAISPTSGATGTWSNVEVQWIAVAA